MMDFFRLFMKDPIIPISQSKTTRVSTILHVVVFNFSDHLRMLQLSPINKVLKTKRQELNYNLLFFCFIKRVKK